MSHALETLGKADQRREAYRRSKTEPKRCFCGAKLNYLNTSEVCHQHGAAKEEYEQDAERSKSVYAALPNLRALKDKRRVSWVELAMRTGIPETSLASYGYARTKAPRPRTEILARALGTTVEELEGDE